VTRLFHRSGDGCCRWQTDVNLVVPEVKDA
jgi:hypothetical protein